MTDSFNFQPFKITPQTESRAINEEVIIKKIKISKIKIKPTLPKDSNKAAIPIMITKEITIALRIKFMPKIGQKFLIPKLKASAKDNDLFLLDTILFVITALCETMVSQMIRIEIAKIIKKKNAKTNI